MSACASVAATRDAREEIPPVDAGLLDHARRDDRGRDVGRAREDARRADRAGHRSGAVHAVLEREDHRLGAAQRRQQRQDLRVGVGLDRQDHEIDRPDPLGLALGLDAHHVVAERAPHQQAALADRPQVRAARQQRDALAAAGQPRAVVASDRARADHGDVHEVATLG
jgi:hypothetical protein